MQSEIRLCVYTIFSRIRRFICHYCIEYASKHSSIRFFVEKKTPFFCNIYECGWETTGSEFNDRAKNYINTC